MYHQLIAKERKFHGNKSIKIGEGIFKKITEYEKELRI